MTSAFHRFTIVWVCLLVGFTWCGAPHVALAKKGKKVKHGAELNGVVHGQEENPLPGATVKLTAPDGSVVLDTTADDKGAFSTKVAAGGTYALRLGHPEYATWETPLEINLDEAYNLTFKLIDTATANKQEAISAFNRGAEWVNGGSSVEAKPLFLRAVELDPTIAEAHLGLTDIYLGEDDLTSAAVSIERFRALRPAEVQGLRVAYEVYDRKGDVARADEMLEGLRGTDFAKPIASQIYNEGVAASQAGNHEQARLQFERSAALEPTLVEPLAGLATLAYNAEDYPAAISAIDRLLAQAPDHTQGLRLRFLVHDAQAQTDTALAAFDAYWAVAPEPAVALLIERAELDFRFGDTESSKRGLERILALHADHPRAHYTLGLIYFQSDRAKARGHLDRFIALAPDDPDAASAREMLQHL